MAFTPKQKHARKQPQGPTHQSPSPVRSIANAVVAKDEDLFLSRLFMSACCPRMPQRLFQRPSQEKVSKDNGVIMNLVMGGEHECDRALSREGTQLVELFRMLVNLFGIASAK